MRIACRRGTFLYVAVIHGLALLVPAEERATWIKEWISELWYVHKEASGGGWRGSFRVLAFSIGAFHDARSMKAPGQEERVSRVPYRNSARHCLGALGMLGLLSALLAVAMPNVRKALEPSPYRDPRTLVVLSRSGFADRGVPSIGLEEYRSWLIRPQHLFSAFALYQPRKASLTTDDGRTLQLRVLTATSNLFPMLGVRIPINPRHNEEATRTASLLLSESAYRKIIHGDPDVLDKGIEIGGRKAIFQGVLADRDWKLPTAADAWIIEPDAATGLAPNALGFVVARLAPKAEAMALGESWHMSVHPTDDEEGTDRRVQNEQGYDCVSLVAGDRQPFSLFAFSLFLALLALPATTSLPLGEYPSHKHPLSWSAGLRRWGFLAAKLLLALPIVFFAPLDLAYLFPLRSPLNVEYLQVTATFSVCLFALRWSLRDQRARCPVCLCTLTNPALVGETSRNFLAWHATELICVDGHGLLHVPGLPTCWFPTQRWIHLDSSWDSLFIHSG